jgi:hypothetical protein
MDRPFKFLLSALLVSVIVLGSASSCKGQIAKIAVEGPSTVGVCREFTVDIWIRDLPASMIEFDTRLEWDTSMMEYISHVSHVSRNGWSLDYLMQSPGLIQLGASGSQFSQDASWITVTFHCLGPGISELRIEESSIEGTTAGIAYNDINLDVNQIESAPVGGVASPINKLEVLAPYVALAGLITAVSAVYVVKRRKD